MDIDLPTGSNKTGADFDDHAHLVLGCSGARMPLAIRCRVAPTWRTQPPAGWDNISIVPLEWLSWQGEKSCHGYCHACFQCYQPLLRPCRKLNSLPAGVSPPDG